MKYITLTWDRKQGFQKNFFRLNYYKGGDSMNKSIILITFETISIFFSSIFTFACGFYVLKITHSGSTFGTYLAILAVITTVSSPF